MSTTIHQAAAKGFQNSSDAYERGRPEYPAEAVEKLVQELEIRSDRIIVDLGAGTGKFTKLLVPFGARIIAVEPVEGMRQKFSSIIPSIETIAGTAESIPLPKHSVDGVVVAQAFHWFNGESALKEIHRILKPEGKLGLIWNSRDETIPWVSELTQIIDPHEKGAPRYKTGAWKTSFSSTNLFTRLELAQFPYVQVGGPEMVIDRVASISFIGALPDQKRSEVLEKVRGVLKAYSLANANCKIEFPYRTDVFWCEKKSQ